MEAIILAIFRAIELFFVEGGIVTVFKAIGALAVFEWMWDHPQVTLGAIAVIVYISWAASEKKKP